MRIQRYLIAWFLIIIVGLGSIIGMVYYVDPLFHYHKPREDKFFYSLEGTHQRELNDGIIKHFDYDAMITGTSMTENFKTSEVDELFNVNSIKVPFAGATYYEINNNIRTALKYNTKLKLVIRGLDVSMIDEDANKLRIDLGEYPTYLYDNNPFNDVNYIFNKDIIFERVYKMIKGRSEKDFKPGIVSFDDYSNWTKNNYGYSYGLNSEHLSKLDFDKIGTPIFLTEEEKEVIKDNITKNVTDIADEYSEVSFYYFYTPYSILTYLGYISDGSIYKNIEKMEYATELILEHKNIKLYSLCGDMSIITDINNYREEMLNIPNPDNPKVSDEFWDTSHYGEWINSYILQCMYKDEYRLTEENYKDVFAKQLSDILEFDFHSLYNQENYKNDYYMAALYNRKIWGVEPIDLIENNNGIELKNAEIVSDQKDGKKIIKCIGNLPRSYDSIITPEDVIVGDNYIGAKITLNNIGKHKYIVFYGKKVEGLGQPTVIVLDDKKQKINEVSASCNDIGNDWEQYIVDISQQNGEITIYFNGGYIDDAGGLYTEYIFSDIILY